MKSLQSQLSISLSFGLIALFGLFWGVMSYSVHHLAEEYIVMRLNHDTENLKKALYQDEQQRIQINLEEVDPIFLHPESGHYFVVKRPSGEPIRSPSLQDHPFYVKSLGSESLKVYETQGSMSDHVMVRVSSWSINDQPIELALAEDHAQIEDMVHLLDWVFALLSLAGLAAIWFWQQTILKRGFSGLQPMRQALETAPHLGVPKDIQVPSEIEPLVNSLNKTLAQLHERLARSRQRTGNLAHSLKTPLNLIYQQLESSRLPAELRQSMSEQAQRINQLIDRELKKARLAGGELHAQTFDFQQDLQDLIEGFQKLYREKDIHYNVQINLQVPFLIDREDGFELLGNLIDNASKWCCQHVSIHITSQQNGLVVMIEDDGKGVEHEGLQRLKQRGQRLDETQPGYGLGLSIVEEIVQIYQGQWQIEPSYLGGLKVKVQLPQLIKNS
ncbi:sensor histidine kinase [Thiomicrospira pelophila]|uniref:sensor histidine kinase n=1 Tax=Thiomicrospira pelophila TaxID=934 RepID=UPI0004A6C652|nr:sensor histidine kinase [Thiomicrospira pelophila]